MKIYRYTITDKESGVKLFDTLFISSTFEYAVFKCESFSKWFAKDRGKTVNIAVIKCGDMTKISSSHMMKVKLALRKKYEKETIAFILYVAK